MSGLFHTGHLKAIHNVLTYISSSERFIASPTAANEALESAPNGG
jgi:hypothetical protein